MFAQRYAFGMKLKNMKIVFLFEKLQIFRSWGIFVFKHFVLVFLYLTIYQSYINYISIVIRKHVTLAEGA